MGSFTSIAEFIACHLPKIIGDGGELTVLFSTYNTVRGHESGEVRTGKFGLRIFVQNGGCAYSSATQIGLVIGVAGGPFNPHTNEIGDHALRAFEEEGRAAQAAVEQRVMDVKVKLAEARRMLLVIYGGLSAFGQALEFAGRLKQDQPNAAVVFVTCTCDRLHKRKTLSPLLEQDELHCVIEDDECGGRGPMRDVLEALIAAWTGKEGERVCH